MSVMNVFPVPEALQQQANMVGEMVRGLIILVAPLALIVALFYTAKLRRERVLVLLGGCALIMVAIVAVGESLPRAVANAFGCLYGALGLALCGRWSLVSRRALA